MSLILDNPALTPRFEIEVLSPRRSQTPPDFAPPVAALRDDIPGYELNRQIGEGGFGRVYEARQIKLDRTVAVKVIACDSWNGDTQTTRFENEVRALSRLHHPNIVPVYDCGMTEQFLYLSMELLEGQDLDARLRTDGPLDERTAWSLVRQAAAGLAHAAAHGVVHRDVKPANLFLIPAPMGSGLPPGIPMVKVMDFGLALAKWGLDGTSRRTAPGVAVGTPAYMAPEQHRGEAVDLRADLYALGATAYHALSGRPPFEGRTVWDVMAKKIEHTPPRLTAGLDESAILVAALMAPDPNRRIQTYEDLIARIDRLTVFRDVPNGPVRPRSIRSRRSRHVALGVAAVLAASTVATAFVLSNRRDPGPPSPVRYVSDGAPVALFDGASIELWSSVGAWTVERDEEGTGILTGSGEVRRSFSSEADYRLILGLDPFEAAYAEVQFAVPAGSGNAPRLLLRVSKDGGATLSRRDGERGTFRSVGNVVPYPSENWLKSRRPYLEVRVERANGEWAVWFNGTPVGRVADDGVPKTDEFRLLAADGAVRIDTVMVERIRPARP